MTGESHAWVEWFCGGTWRGYDPTNLIDIGDRHVIVGRGRDYNDIAPLRGCTPGRPRRSCSCGSRSRARREHGGRHESRLRLRGGLPGAAAEAQVPAEPDRGGEHSGGGADHHGPARSRGVRDPADQGALIGVPPMKIAM